MADIDELYFMKFDNTPNTGAGLITKSKVEILDDLKTISRASFGSDLSIEQGTAWYVFLDFLADGLNSISAATKELYNSIGIPNAYGVTLDAAVSLCGITRKEGESDEQLRYRAITSIYKQAVGITSGMEAALLNLIFIKYAKVYDNTTSQEIQLDPRDTSSTTYKISPYCCRVVVSLKDGYESGQFVDGMSINKHIAQTILKYKTLGSGTNGGTAVQITDETNNDTRYIIRFDYVLNHQVSIKITTDIDMEQSDQVVVKSAISEYINSLAPGEAVTLTGVASVIAKVYDGSALVKSIYMSSGDTTPTSATYIEILNYETATCAIANITITK